MITSTGWQTERTGEAPGGSMTADPLGFLKGRRYTCYCGRSVEGTMLCQSCAEEMVACLVTRTHHRPQNLQKLARTDH